MDSTDTIIFLSYCMIAAMLIGGIILIAYGMTMTDEDEENMD